MRMAAITSPASSELAQGSAGGGNGPRITGGGAGVGDGVTGSGVGMGAGAGSRALFPFPVDPSRSSTSGEMRRTLARSPTSGSDAVGAGPGADTVVGGGEGTGVTVRTGEGDGVSDGDGDGSSDGLGLGWGLGVGCGPGDGVSDGFTASLAPAESVPPAPASRANNTAGMNCFFNDRSRPATPGFAGRPLNPPSSFQTGRASNAVALSRWRRSFGKATLREYLGGTDPVGLQPPGPNPRLRSSRRVDRR